jgi:tripartite-type tricarboxylate transporter receptor subunit TctC
MKRSRLSIYFLFLVMAVGFFGFQNSSFAAERYPEKPIEVIVPFPPGGPTDIGIRIISDQLAKVLKNPVVVINKGGGSAAVGTSQVVSAKKDGYTLLAGTSTPIVVIPVTNPKEVTYDSLRDLEPVAHCISLVTCMTVRQDSRFNTFEDLEKHVKANPGKVSVGVPGMTHPYYLYQILKDLGLDMNLVIAKGDPQNVSYLLGGHVEAIMEHMGITAPYVREGKMKPIVVYHNKRLPSFPNMPSIAEKGYPRAALLFFIGFFAPKGTPQPIVDVLASALEEATKDPEVVAKLGKLEYPVDFKRGPEFRALIEEHQKIIQDIATKANIIQK